MLYHIIRCDPFYAVVAVPTDSPFSLSNKNTKRNLAMAALYMYAPLSKMTTETVQHVATNNNKKNHHHAFNTCREMQNDRKILTTNVRKKMLHQDSAGITLFLKNALGKGGQPICKDNKKS